MSNINPRDNLSITFPEGLLHVMDSKEQETHWGEIVFIMELKMGCSIL